MATEKNAFEARLRRIEETRRTQEQEEPKPQPRKAKPARDPRQRGHLVKVLMACLGAIGFVGALVLFSPQITSATAAILKTDAVAAGRGTQPADFLPVAPEGWIRVTTRDVQDPAFLADFSARWPAKVGLPLQQNLGYRSLENFVRLYAEPDLEMRVLAKTRTAAIYMHPDGEYLTVRLKFRAAKAPLGPKLDEVAWIKKLAEIETKELEADEKIEIVRLGDMTVINRTKPHGNSLFARPIGEDLDSPNGIKVSAALTDRAVMRIKGLVPPRVAAEILDTTDRAALLDLLDD